MLSLDLALTTRRETQSYRQNWALLGTWPEKASDRKVEPKALKKLTMPQEKAFLDKVTSLIYECSPNKAAATALIDRILRRL